MVLAKEKNENAAMSYFLKSIHAFPMNWGCWLEMTNLISRVEQVGWPQSRRRYDSLTAGSLTK
jgi:hypothetical protein